MELFHFLRPWFLLAGLPFLGLLYKLWHQSSADSGWRKIVAPELLQYVLLKQEGEHKRWPFWVIGFVGLMMIIALSGPTWERIPQPVFTIQEPLVLALDLSASMDAQDLQPSRLARARFKLADILEQRNGGQTALLVYAGDAFTVTPLTDDVKTIKAQLQALDTSLLPAQGSNTLRAITLAQSLLQQAGLQQGRVILLTDEIRDPGILSAIKELTQAGYELSVLGIGTAQGAPIPARGGMIKDADGNIVIPKLDASRLGGIAAAGDGLYASITLDDEDLRKLGLDKPRAGINHNEVSEQTADQWREVGPWLLLLALPLAALLFRRGIIIVVMLVVVPLPELAEASWWQDLWKNSDQKGAAFMQQQKAAEAAEIFVDPEWRAAAKYRAEDWNGALQAYQALPDSEARYNEGNTLVQMEKLEEAVAAYQQALQLDAEHTDAKHNKEIVEAMLQQQQDQQQNKDQQQEQNKDEQSEKQPGEQQSSDEQQKESGEQDEQQQNADGQPQQSSDEKAQDSKDEARKNEDQDVSQQEKEAYAQEVEQKSQQAEKEPHEETEAQQQAVEQEPATEQQLALEQWLGRIPDDPAGLLRRKFQYQYNQRQNHANESQPW